MESGELARVLREARALITPAHRWQPRGYATDAAGRFVPIGSPAAVAFSTLGAIIRACHGTRDVYQATRSLFDAAPFQGRLSADLTHAESLELLDAVLESVTSRPAYTPKHSGFIVAGGGAAAPEPRRAESEKRRTR